eukprot:3168123-Ditylum_brightwellii.AAC.1
MLMGSSSNDPACFYQQGGTCMEITDKMIGRIIASDTNDSGLGQWSYVKVAGRNQKQITIVTTYRPYKQSNPGEST